MDFDKEEWNVDEDYGWKELSIDIKFLAQKVFKTRFSLKWDSAGEYGNKTAYIYDSSTDVCVAMEMRGGEHPVRMYFDRGKFTNRPVPFFQIVEV